MSKCLLFPLANQELTKQQTSVFKMKAIPEEMAKKCRRHFDGSLMKACPWKDQNSNALVDVCIHKPILTWQFRGQLAIFTLEGRSTTVQLQSMCSIVTGMLELRIWCIWPLDPRANFSTGPWNHHLLQLFRTFPGWIFWVAAKYQLNSHSYKYFPERQQMLSINH